MPIKSKIENLLSARTIGSLSVVAAILCTFAMSPASAASPEPIQPDLLPSSSWGSGPIVASLAQLIRHEGPIRGDEPKSTANPEDSPAILMARAHIAGAGRADQTPTGTPQLGGLPTPRPSADLFSLTRTAPNLAPVAYALPSSSVKE
jgi:hypothetical protein